MPWFVQSLLMILLVLGGVGAWTLVIIALDAAGEDWSAWPVWKQVATAFTVGAMWPVLLIILGYTMISGTLGKLIKLQRSRRKA